jgi:hypothetical protein
MMPLATVVTSSEKAVGGDVPAGVSVTVCEAATELFGFCN